MSLGVVPVGVSRRATGAATPALLALGARRHRARGAPLPALITEYPELDVEQIIALQPDVVLAPFSGMSAQAYAQLSRFVPRGRLSGHPFLTPVDTQIDLTAAALGKRAEARCAQGPHRTLAAARRARQPGTGRQDLRLRARADLGSGNFAAYVAGDPRVDTISAMGLTLAPSVRKLRASAGHSRTTWASSMPTGWPTSTSWCPGSATTPNATGRRPCRSMPPFRPSSADPTWP